MLPEFDRIISNTRSNVFNYGASFNVPYNLTPLANKEILCSYSNGKSTEVGYIVHRF